MSTLLIILMAVTSVVLVFSIGWHLGRIYSFEHEVKIAQDGWKRALDGWDRATRLVNLLVKGEPINTTHDNNIPSEN